jgi:molybdopterin converting factor small subunit
LQLFAVARQTAGTNRLRLELTEPATVAALRRAVGEHVPALRPILPAMLVAVDATYATDDVVIGPGSELALIPPVSGGADRQLFPHYPAPVRPFRVANLKINPLALEMIPESIAHEYQVLPLDFDGDRLTLVFARGCEIAERLAKLRFVLNFANPISWSRADAVPLARAIDEAYRLAATGVANCPSEFRTDCPKLWLCLAPTDDPNVRVCQVCRCFVHYCQTETEALERESEGQRIALFRQVESEAVDVVQFDDLTDPDS